MATQTPAPAALPSTILPHRRFGLSPIAVSISLLIIVAAGILLRLHLLDHRDLWDDEAASVIFAQLPWSGFVSTIRNYEANMVLYYLLLRYWLHFGDSVAFIRGLSVVFGVAAIPAIYMLGERLFGVKEGLAAAALSAVNTFQVRYSQEARSYSLVILLSILSTFLLVRAMETPGQKRYWFGYIAMSTLGIYAHAFFFLVVLAQWLSVGYGLLRKQWKTTIWTAGILILLNAPMGLFLIAENQGQLNWVLPPSSHELLEFFKLFTGYGGSPLLAVYSLLCVAAVLQAYREERDPRDLFDRRQRTNLIVCWLAFPLGFVIFGSYIQPIFYDRYLAISAPALALLAGKGLVDLKRLFPRLRAVVPGSLVLLLCLSLWGVRRYNRSQAAEGDEWKSVTEYILAGQQPGDGAFFYRASGSRVFKYYAYRQTEEHGGSSSPEIVFPYDVTNAQDFNVEPGKDQAKLALGSHKRIWLILQHYRELPERRAAKQNIQDALGMSYRLSQQKDFPGATGAIEVLLYVRDTPADTHAQASNRPQAGESSPRL